MRKVMVLSAAVILAAWSSAADSATGAEQPSEPDGGALAGQRPRVIVSTDIGGGDPDDCQSMVHLLVYADVLDIEGLVASPPQAGRAKNILEVIDAYEKDYAHLRRHAEAYPTPDSLRAITKQGAVDPAPAEGWNEPTEGSRWIIERAKAGDARPLWVLVWGSITDVAQAVHDDPSIKGNIRVYSIGSWNSRHDPTARDYLYQNHSDLWWIENDTTLRGMFTGGRQEGEWANDRFVQEHVRGHGALGAVFPQDGAGVPGLKMGDTPSVLYLLRGDPDDPTKPHWGGAFVKTGHGPHYWTDDPDDALAEPRRPDRKTGGPWQVDYLRDWQRREAVRAGAKTVSRWRIDFLRDWQHRMDRADE